VNNEPTLGLVRAAIASANCGATLDYFRENAYTHGPLRSRFALLAAGLADSDSGFREEAVSLVGEVNGIYHTRYSVAHLSTIVDAAVSRLRQADWLAKAPPALLSCGVSERSTVAQVYMDILRSVVRCGGKNPWSLLTKWLHLLYPDTYVIYDQNASASIKRWSDVVNANLSESALDRLQFDTENRRWNGSYELTWYVGLLKFYQECWDVSVANGLDGDLVRAADSIQVILRRVPSSNHCRITVVDVVDCHLWRCNGDGRKLGLY